MDKLKMQTPNKADENFKKLAAMFPNAVTETIDENGEVIRAIDKDVLMQEINTKVVDGKEERYQFTWPDKKKSVLLANAPISKTLRPCREESVDFDNTENLYIEGDNLEVLKLLQETYLGKIKMIYIDPPYNTGNDFVYEDDFRTESLEFRERSGNYDEQGNLLTDRMTLNTESNGRFHTDWLNMIYPRLKLAKDLLSDDGVIFISIADEEIDNIKKVCDEIFGECNFKTVFSRVTKKGGKSSAEVAKNHDFLLMYVKDIENADLKGIAHIDEGYCKKDEYFEQRGYYKANQTLDYDSLGYVKTLDYPIEIGGEVFYAGGSKKMYEKRQSGEHGRADWGWRWSKELFEFGFKNGFVEVHKGGDRSRIYTKTYEKVTIDRSGNEYKIIEFDRTKPLSTLEFTENEYSNDNAKKVFDALMGKGIFEYTKPPVLIKTLQSLIASKDFICLDFFSGSATTAHAVMQLNAEDGGHRKFIMVQIPEETDKNSEAYKAGYKNICEIGKERIRRAGDQILELRLESLEKEGVIEKLELSKEKLEKDAGKLSKTRSLEEIYGLSGNGVSTGEETSTGGNLRTVRPNEKSGGVDSVEHCGGAVKGKEGIYPIFENSKGFTSRTGDTIVDLRTLEVLNRFGYRINFEYIRGNQQNDLFADSESKLQTLRAKLSFLRSDHGFRVLKCDTSNMKDVFYRPDEVEQDMFDNYANNIKPDRTAEDLLFQTMLDLGVLLSSKIETKIICKKEVFCVKGNYLMACFDKDVTEDVITEIAKQKPYYFVMRDPSDSQDGDSLITNFEQIFATYSPDTQRKIL